jgi:hypothetical protein
MSQSSFFKNPPVKILLITILMIAVLVVGFIPLTLVLIMKQTLLIKVIIATSGILWAIFTDIFLWNRTDYIQIWHQWRHDIKHQKQRSIREKYPEYMALREKYPLSIRRYEQHTRHRKEKISEEQMIENALKVDEKEWAEREAFRREAKEERDSYKNDNTSSHNGAII